MMTAKLLKCRTRNWNLEIFYFYFYLLVSKVENKEIILE